MMFMEKPIDAHEAYRIGLVNKVVPAEQVMPVAKEWAEDLCKKTPLYIRTEPMIRSRGLSINEAL
jgi:enoyl-CoA hydratase/carnithine racemase